MFATVSVELPTHLHQALRKQMASGGAIRDIPAALAAAVELWLAEQRRLAGDPAGSAPHGYQWKTLFLPEGTVLRSWSYGEHNYACVEGDSIIHQGRMVSPNQFAQSFTRASRNCCRL